MNVFGFGPYLSLALKYRFTLRFFINYFQVQSYFNWLKTLFKIEIRVWKAKSMNNMKRKVNLNEMHLKEIEWKSWFDKQDR